MPAKLNWYGYLHINGTLHIKRFLGDYGDIDECKQSDFVLCSVGPFEAESRKEAFVILQEKIK